MRWLKILTAVLLSVAALAYLALNGVQAYQMGWLQIREWFVPDRPEPTRMVLSEDRAKQMAEKKLRQQILTFDGFQPLMQTSGNLFMIGVGQNTLLDPEQIRSADKRIFLRPSSIRYDMPSPYSGSEEDRSKPQPLEGIFNNILLYDASTDDVVEVFQDRVLVHRAEANWAKVPTHLILFAVTRDGDGDGVLSTRDNSELFVYNIPKRKAIRIETIDAEPESISHVFGADYMIVQFRVDRNKDGRFVSYGSGAEPQRYAKVNLNTGAISDLVPDELRQRLQKRLQGEEP